MSGSTTVSKISFRQITKKLEKMKQDDLQDRKENPHLIPVGWKGAIERMITGVLRANREKVGPDTTEQLMKYLEQRAYIVKYTEDDYSFPGVDLPTKEEIVAKVKTSL